MNTLVKGICLLYLSFKLDQLLTTEKVSKAPPFIESVLNKTPNNKFLSYIVQCLLKCPSLFNKEKEAFIANFANSFINGGKIKHLP